MALRTPFARVAEGVRLPDGNPNSTVTFALTRKVTFNGNAYGDIDLVILPNLITNMFTTRGNFSGTTLSLADLGTTLGTRYPPTTVSTAVGLGFDTEALGAQYSRYRIVSYGVRLRMSSSIAGLGEFTVSVLPLKGMAPVLSTQIPAVVGPDGTTVVGSNSYWSGINPRNTMQNYLSSLGLPYKAGVGPSPTQNDAQVDITKLVNIPNHATVSSSEVAARGLHCRGLPFESDARTFRAMGYTSMGTDCMDLAIDMSSGATAVQQMGVDYSPWRIGGHEAIVIGGSNFSSTTCGSIEIIYHVEATPNPQYSLLARPTSAIPYTTPSTTLDQVLSKSHHLPRISFADVITQAGDALLGDVEGRVAAAGVRGLGSLGGALSRMILSGA